MAQLRKASTLILAASDASTSAIKILALQRSSSSSHFPDAHVFPGGNLDDADSSQEWLSLLPSETHDVPLNILGLPSESKDHADNQISAAISSRITAIRETFEECGILLCQRVEDRWVPHVKHLELNGAHSWRQRIRNNAYEFLNLCRTQKCFPNIKGLYFLNNWITPENYERRYDCKFFIAVMDKLVEAAPDHEEINILEWNSVKYFLESDDIFLPPPQFYEFTMLSKFQKIDALMNYAQNMNNMKCHPMIPVFISASDGMIFLFPGDEMYEKVYNQRSGNVNEDNFSVETYQRNVMNRIVIQNNIRQLILQNFSPRQYVLKYSAKNDPISKL